MNTVLRFLIVLPLVLTCTGGECKMPGGTLSTLTVNPTGGSTLTMGLEGSEPYTGTSPYIVPLQTLTLNEAERWRIVYEQAGTGGGEGGRAVSSYGDLVPLSFWVVIKASTRIGLIAAYNDLQAALLNPLGGTIAYLPEDVPAGTLTTYYHYVQSGPPRVLDQAKNRWDAGAHADGYFRLIVEVALQTQPIATSNPASPVTLTALATTIQNWEDTGAGQTNSVLVDEADLKGTMPALLRITAQPDAGHDLGELIVYKRDEGTLANFVSVYEAEDAATIDPSTAWSEIDDPDRGNAHYMRCLPSVNDEAQGLRFTIANPADHEGRFAVFGVGYVAGGEWAHQAKLRVGNIIQESEDDYQAEDMMSWGIIYAGEFELPPASLSSVETAYDEGPYIEWYATRTLGTDEFRLDGIVLVYVADSKLQPTALDVPGEDEDGDGVTNSDKLLVENFPGNLGTIRELAHIVAQADNDFERLPTEAPRGDFLTLDPTKDNLLVFLQQRSHWTTVLDDDFEGYDGVKWMAVDDMENVDTWVGAAVETAEYVEGAQSLEIQITGGIGISASMHKLVDLDLEHEGAFPAGAFSCYVAWKSGDTTNVQTVAHFHTVYDTDEYASPAYDLAGTYNFIYQKKSAFSAVGAPNWGDVDRIELEAINGDVYFPKEIAFDWWRLENADPDDANSPNATGNQWNFQPAAGIWTITEDMPGVGATLACLDDEVGVEKSALIDETTPNDVRFRARVLAKIERGNPGYVGLVWRSGQDTLTVGAEDCYAALLDITNNKLLVREYAAGAVTQHANPAFNSKVNVWYVIGVVVQGSTFKVYAHPVTGLSTDDHVFDAANLLATVTDATYDTGQCGVMSISTLGRFDEVKLEGLSDRHIPADEITLEGQAIFRTIAPFNE